MNRKEFEMQLSDAIWKRLMDWQKPKEDRASSRLLVLHKDTGDVEHKAFTDISSFIKGELWVNESSLARCRLKALRGNGRETWLVFVNKLADERWRVQMEGEPDFKDGECFSLLDGTVCKVMGTNGYWAEVITSQAPDFDAFGTVPLLAGVERPRDERDVTAYEPLWAHVPGSKTLGTAGIHFSRDILEKFSLRRVTLHITYNSTSTITEEEVDRHQLPAEEFAIESPPAQGQKVVAVGTTVARALETWAADGRRSGWTGLFIKPPYEFKAVESLVTNFHMPGDSLFVLCAALAGRDLLLHAYVEAVKEDYDFGFFGDSMLIL
jgi:S-adenosylmethionine:tRNA ribosyltransferase-isomerase